jgi:hypothetical protein
VKWKKSGRVAVAQPYTFDAVQLAQGASTGQLIAGMHFRLHAPCSRTWDMAAAAAALQWRS